MNLPSDFAAWQTAIRRRTFLRSSAYGLGGIALAGLLDPSLFSGTARGAADTTRPGDRWRGVLNPPHLPIKAKRVIHLCMAGGPSQFETLRLQAEAEASSHGKPFPESFTKGQQLAQLQNTVLKARGPFVRVPEARPVGPGDLRPVPAHRRASPTTSASSARCRPSRSITTRRTRS